MGCIRGQSNVFETNFGINVSLNQFGCVCVCISLKSPEKLSQIQRVFGKPVVTWTLQCIVNQIYEALAGKKYPEKVPNSSSLHLVLKWRWSCQLIYSMNRGFPITIMLDNIFGIIFFFFPKKVFSERMPMPISIDVGNYIILICGYWGNSTLRLCWSLKRTKKKMC